MNLGRSRFARLHPKYQTPVNSILFVGTITLAFSILGLIGVGKQEAFQLLWNGIFYGLTYLAMFAIPLRPTSVGMGQDRRGFRIRGDIPLCGDLDPAVVSSGEPTVVRRKNQ